MLLLLSEVRWLSSKNSPHQTIRAHMEKELLTYDFSKRRLAAKQHSGIHIAVRDNKYGIMFGNTKNVLDHLEGCSKSDDLLKQRVYFPHWPTANNS